MGQATSTALKAIKVFVISGIKPSQVRGRNSLPKPRQKKSFFLAFKSANPEPEALPYTMKTFSALFALLLTASLAVGEDWPQWRGPLRDDVSTETGLLKQWPAGGPPLAWKATGLGECYSGVSVVGGRIYTMGDIGEASFLLALDAANGKVIWSTKVGKSGGDRPGPRCTPSVD